MMMFESIIESILMYESARKIFEREWIEKRQVT
jgi:hypothetical protein